MSSAKLEGGLSMIASVLAIAVAMASGWPGVEPASGPTPQQGSGPSTQPRAAKKAQTYDGNWWLATDEDERAGFLDGASDCLVWTAHDLNFSETSSQVGPRITKYYQAHPSQRALSILAVWQKTEPKVPEPVPKGGETWKNAHWYLNGLWWRGSYRPEQEGFLEGYLWCMRTRVKPPRQSYSRPVDYYAAKISEYLQAHPEADDKSIASILSRYQDKGGKTSN